MKRLFTLLLCVVMLVAAIPAVTVSAEEPFADVKESHWFYNAVNYCYNNGLMSGMKADEFSPNGKVSREQFVQTLANMEGINKDDYLNKETPFTDVKKGAWYEAAVEWARQTGIVAGLSETTFGIGNYVTREQIARLLRGYAEYKGKQIKETDDLSAFVDSAKISSWALDGFKYAIASGIFKGNAKNELNPRGNATRAELATILKAVRAYENNVLVAWGDSLTQGIIEGFHDISKNPYPKEVGRILNVESYNFGIGGETAEAIAMRQGGIEIYLENVTIPAEVATVAVTITAEDGYSTETLAAAGEVGLNPVTVDGIEGNITEKDGSFFFTRSVAGEEKVITDPVQIITSGMGFDYSNAIMVICSGANNTKDQAWHDDPVTAMNKLCAIQQEMVEYAGTDRFVIIGLPKVKFMQNIPKYNYILEEYWGDHFVDINPYLMSEQAFKDMGIEMAGRDKKDIIQYDRIPRTFLDALQELHPNQMGYDLMSKVVAEHINKMDYIK